MQLQYISSLNFVVNPNGQSQAVLYDETDYSSWNIS